MTAINLSDLHFFAQLPDDARARMRDLAEELTAEAGAVLTEQGAVGREAFVIQSGQAEVTVSGARVATIGPGSLVGEMAIIDRRPRSATVTALTDMELLRFDAPGFLAILHDLPEFAVAKLARHSEETREANLRDVP